MAEQFPVIAVGGSAGSLDALGKFLRDLPDGLPAALCVALHVPPYSKSAVPNILSRISGLPADHVNGPMALCPGRVYVAPPDFHMVFEDSVVRPDHGPRVNRHRPSIDVMLRSAARNYGARAVGVILSGNLDDGTAGLAAIQAAGGLTAVQDPADAEFPSMPANAMRAVSVDVVAPAAELGKGLVAALSEQTRPQMKPPGAHEASSDMNLRCPDCNGPLVEQHQDGVTTFACRVGHEYSFDRLAIAQSEAVEWALWSAVSILEEQATLTERLAERAREQARAIGEAHFRERSRTARGHARVIRDLLESGDGTTVDPLAG